MHTQIRTESVLENIRFLFDKYKIKRLAGKHFIKYLKKDTELKNKLMSLNDNNLDKKLKSIYWATADVQVELGYMLIHHETILQEQNLLPCMIFEHHYIQSIDSIYRCWECVAQVISYIHTKNEKKEGYYNTIVDKMCKSKKYSSNIVKKLKSHEKNWAKIANARNNYSHEFTSLICDINFDIYETQSTPEAKNIKYDSKRKINEAYDKFKYLKNLTDTLDMLLTEYFNNEKNLKTQL